MRLFHCSNIKTDDYLDPQLGFSRHGGEDPRFADVPGIWFSDDPNFIRQVEGKVQTYKYEVEIEETDPNLELDQKLVNGIAIFNKELNCNESVKWYFYTARAKIVKRYIWSGKSYVSDESFLQVCDD